MSHPVIIQNAFDSKTINQLMRKLEFVSFDQSPENVMKELQELSSDQYIWAVCKAPSYFLQYQLKSSAIIKVKGLVLIVWKPKYIEYPSMVKFPDFNEKRLSNMKVTISEGTTTEEQTNQVVEQFLMNFYGTLFHTDSDFQTNLITNCKHMISRVTKHSYWHAIIDQTNSLFVSQMSKMDNVCKVRVTGVKDGYDKTILMFAFKGKRVNFFMAAKNKWMQMLSFISMLLIFYSVTACSSGESEGICGYRQQMTMIGTGIMLSLIGLRYVKDKRKNKKKTAMSKTNPQKKQN